MSSISRILADDPELTDGLSGERLDAAIRDCVAGTREFPAGPWSPPEVMPDMSHGLGLLILDGLVARRVGVAGRFGAELLGDGDLMNPFHRQDMGTLLPRHIATNMAIVQQPRIDLRLHMLFWELADRWGTVHQDGVHVRLNLTHAMLSDLVAARRPTVTKALGELAARSAVVWTGSDWLLPAEPPAEFEDVGSLTIAGAA
jgi:CRP/FNR family transcriptional regulator, cyclic AMP receptor protein